MAAKFRDIASAPRDGTVIEVRHGPDRPGRGAGAMGRADASMDRRRRSRQTNAASGFRVATGGRARFKEGGRDGASVFAEFETNLRKERQLEGIAEAKTKGVYTGRSRP